MKTIKATKEITAQDVPVDCGRPVITLPAKDIDGNWTKATVNFNIDGVAPVTLTDKQLNAFWAWAEPIAKEAPNLKDVTPVDTAQIEPI